MRNREPRFTTPLSRFVPLFLRRRFEDSEVLRRVAANSGWLFFDRVLRMAVGLWISIWIARYLGPDQFGLLNYAAAFVLIFSAFASMGLENVVIRDLLRAPSRRDEILGSALCLRLIGGLLVIVLSTGSIFFVNHADDQLHGLVVLLSIGAIFQAFDIIDLWFQSQLRSRQTVVAKSVAFLVSSAAKILLIILQAPLYSFAIVSSAELALGAAGLLIVLRWQQTVIHLKHARWDECLRLLKESWPLILSGLAVLAYMRVDQIMLGQMSGTRDVGVYSAALRISELWYFMPLIVMTSANAVLMKLRVEDVQRYYYRLSQLMRWLVWTAIVVSIVTTFISGFLIDLLYGPEYLDAGRILAIHVWTSVFVFMGVVSGGWLVSEGMQKLDMSRTLFGLIVNVALNLFLIPRYGAIGAAAATLAAQICAAYLFDALFDKTRPMFWIKSKSLWPSR